MPNDKVGFRALHIGQCNQADWVASVKTELMFVLDNYVDVKKIDRRAAQTKLISQLPGIQSQFKAATKNLDKQIKAEDPSRSFDQRKPIFSARAAPIRHQFADPVVQGFEVAYKATRTDKNEIIKRVANMAQFIGAPDHVGIGRKANNDDNWQVYVYDGANWIAVIELWFGDARFIATSEEGVFVHRTKPERQYVRDRNGFFIARYLIRNLSKFDRDNIGEDPALKARTVKIPTEETLIADITQHVRSKEASGGGTCFISFSHTKNIIVGSTGALFYRQETGDVIIDAAKLNISALVDLHSLDAVLKLFEVADVQPTMPFSENSEAYERNAAARDTIRTREILVAGSVPRAAVLAVRLSSATAKAPWTTLEGANAVLPTGIPDAWKT
jgi:hypothetical protein